MRVKSRQQSRENNLRAEIAKGANTQRLLLFQTTRLSQIYPV